MSSQLTEKQTTEAFSLSKVMSKKPQRQTKGQADPRYIRGTGEFAKDIQTVDKKHRRPRTRKQLATSAFNRMGSRLRAEAADRHRHEASGVSDPKVPGWEPSYWPPFQFEKQPQQKPAEPPSYDRSIEKLIGTPGSYVKPGSGRLKGLTRDWIHRDKRTFAMHNMIGPHKRRRRGK